MIVSEVLFLNWVKGYNGSTEYGAYVAVPVVVMLFGLLLIVCACIYTRFCAGRKRRSATTAFSSLPDMITACDGLPVQGADK